MAFTLALAGLTAPLAANAARAATEKSAPSTAAAYTATTTKTGHIFSGLTDKWDLRELLEDSARKKLDESSDLAIKNLRTVGLYKLVACS